MTDSLKTLGQIHQLAGRLNPAAFASKAAEYRRGSLPGQSMSDGRGGGTGNVGFDLDDQEFRGTVGKHAFHLREALKQLQLAERCENSILNVRHVDMQAKCSRPDCPNVLDVGRTQGECGTHRSQKSRAKELAK